MKAHLCLSFSSKTTQGTYSNQLLLQCTYQKKLTLSTKYNFWMKLTSKAPQVLNN